MNTLAIALYPNASETVSFMLIGFIVVVGVLACLMLATTLMGMPFKMADEKAAKKAAQAKEKARLEAEEQARLEKEKSREIAGVISSAVYAALDGAPHRVVSVKPAEGLTPELLAVISAAAAVAAGSECAVSSIKRAAPDFNWASSGRNAIFSSKSPKR
ncbi:OadG family transporter subunit [Intestinicryptomonas porci]|uniref:OadG family protein n=1 Tax=Intestinicryptomonas porci TaxID=2926320 RepID=A0ABU4WHP6_9BACT|nr:OadG family protein [Opitutales bacterium CLA-KB-P66]